MAVRHEDFANSLVKMQLSSIEDLADERNAFKELRKGPFEDILRSRAADSSLSGLTILIDALDESKGCMIVDLLIDLGKVFGDKGFINFIVTTQPEPALLSNLRSHR
jgi:hypothetical protein